MYLIILMLALLTSAAYSQNYIGGGLVTEGSVNDGTESGSGNAFVVTIPKIGCLITGQTISFKATHANTGAATLALNGCTAVNLTKTIGGPTTALAANDILNNQPVGCRYDGTQCVMTTPIANSSGGGSGSTPEVNTFTTITGTSATTVRAGYRTDGPIGFTLIADGTSWKRMIDGRVLANAPVDGTAWFNQGACTIAVTDGTKVMDCTGASDGQTRGRVDTVSTSGGWGYAIAFRALCTVSDCGVGILIRNNTGGQHAIWGLGNFNSNRLYGRYLTGTGTSISAGPLDYSPAESGSMHYYCITDTGTTMTAHLSVDGVLWVPRLTTIRSHMTSGADQIGLAGRNGSLIRVYGEKLNTGSSSCPAL